MQTGRMLQRVAIAVVAAAAIADFAALGYAHFALERALAPGATIALTGGNRGLIYRSDDFDAGWFGGRGHGVLLLPLAGDVDPLRAAPALPVTLRTNQGLAFDGSVVRIDARVKAPEAMQETLDRLADPDPLAASVRVYPWRGWTLRASLRPASGNVGLAEISFAGATLWLERRSASTMHGTLAVGRIKAYRGDSDDRGLVLQSVDASSDSRVESGIVQTSSTLALHGLQLGRYRIDSIRLKGSGKNLRPFDPTTSVLLAAPAGSGEALRIADFEIRTANGGRLKGDADITVPPFQDGNLADLESALFAGFKLRAALAFDRAFGDYFSNGTAPTSAGPWPRLFRLDASGDYVCHVSVGTGHLVVNGRPIGLPPAIGTRLALPPPRPMSPLLPHALPRAPVPQLPVVPPPASSRRIDWLPFRLGESLPQVRAGLSGLGESIDLPPGRIADIHLRREGIWLFFSADGTVRTIRLDAPFAGRVRGIAVGDSAASLHSLLGAPLRPPWPFGGNMAYVYRDGSGMLRYDVGDGVARTIFELSPATGR